MRPHKVDYRLTDAISPQGFPRGDVNEDPISIIGCQHIDRMSSGTGERSFRRRRCLCRAFGTRRSVGVRRVSAPTEAQVLDIAIQSCKANTIKEQWANCAVGRWIGTARYLLVADVCKAVDENGDPHKVLFFSKDGVAATDDEIQQDAGLRINHGWIPPKGCTKIAVYDRDKPARTEPEESLVVRSVAKDKAH